MNDGVCIGTWRSGRQSRAGVASHTEVSDAMMGSAIR